MDAWFRAVFHRAKGSPSSSSAVPFPPIRAPLSGDSEDDDNGDNDSSEVSANSDGVASRFSDASSSFPSGDDEFDTPSEKPSNASERSDNEAVEEEDGDGGRIPFVRSYDLSLSPGICGPMFTMVPIAKLSSETEDEGCEVGDGVSSDGDDGFHGVFRVPVETRHDGLVGDRCEELDIAETENSKLEGVGLEESGVQGGKMEFLNLVEENSHSRGDPIPETIGSSGTSSLEVEDNGGKLESGSEAEIAGVGPKLVDSSANNVDVVGADGDQVDSIEQMKQTGLFGRESGKKAETTNEHVKYSIETVMVEAPITDEAGMCEEPFMSSGSSGSPIVKREGHNGVASSINVILGKETVSSEEDFTEPMTEAGSRDAENKEFAECKTTFVDGESAHQKLESELGPVPEAMGSAAGELQTSYYVGAHGDGTDLRVRLGSNQETSPTSSQGPDGVDDLLTIRNKQKLDIDDGLNVTCDSNEDVNFVRELENFVNFSGNADVRLGENWSTISRDEEAAESEEEEERGDEGDEDKVLFDSATLTALLKAASNVNARSTSEDPAGLGSSVPPLGLSAPHRPSSAGNFAFPTRRQSETENMDDEKLHDQTNMIRMKFLRLVYRLGYSLDEIVAAQVLYKLALAEGTRNSKTSRLFSIDAAFQTAKNLEEDGKDNIDFSCTILVIGKTGVGKSATINSIFGEDKVPTDAFQPATSMVREITGVVDGVKIRVVDTPGLRHSVMEQSTNMKILSSVKNIMKKVPPDIILYVDRMDTCSRDTDDLPLLQSITAALGASVWFNVTVALTHASSALPEGPSGSALPYDSIRQAVGDMRLMNQVVLVENHPSCRRDEDGHQVLPNGQSWRPRLLLLCYSAKILTEVNSLLKTQDPASTKLLFGGHRYRSAPILFLLSSLLQSRSHPLASSYQEEANFDMELSEADTKEVEEYDQLPPFKPLGKSQIAKLSKAQRKAYFEEYDYRVRLFQKKQLKEELRQRREAMKLSGSCSRNRADGSDSDDGDRPSIPMPLPDMSLPPAFDGDGPAYRYRSLEPTESQLLARPVLDPHGWDHDCGYDGIILEDNRTIASQFPTGLVLQITKDKKEFSIHVDSSISMKHGDHGSTMAAFDVQTLGKQLAYTFRGESRLKNFKRNKTAAGLSFTLFGETAASGIKIEDQIPIGRRATLAMSAGAMRAQGDVAYGANLEGRIMEKDYPIGQDGTTIGLSLMQWRRDLALGANLQTEFSVGRDTKTALRIGLNNKRNGQITVKISSSEQLQIAVIGLLPIAAAIFRSILTGGS
ncbi:unnamed protein product [Victoria cruziana]